MKARRRNPTLTWTAIFCAAATGVTQEPTLRTMQEDANIEIRVNLKDKSERTLIFEAQSINRGKNAVYIVTDPERSDRSKGPYTEVRATIHQR